MTPELTALDIKLAEKTILHAQRMGRWWKWHRWLAVGLGLALLAVVVLGATAISRLRSASESTSLSAYLDPQSTMAEEDVRAIEAYVDRKVTLTVGQARAGVISIVPGVAGAIMVTFGLMLWRRNRVLYALRAEMYRGALRDLVSETNDVNSEGERACPGAEDGGQ